MGKRLQNRGCGPTALATAILAIVAACGISEIGTADMPMDKEQEGIGSPFRSVCCVSGLEYPSGYDWNADPQKGEVRCSLVVFADGVPRIRVPVGDGYEAVSDPDMHSVIDGNLYTFYSKDGRTVVRQNGAPLFRYDGDEVMLDMVVKDDDVYILAHKRSGEGFSLRKNGEVMLERFSGETFGKLWDDGDSLCFAFVQPVVLSGGLEFRHYIAYNGDAVRVQTEETFERVWDLMSDGGQPCILASLRGTGETVLVMDGSKRRIGIPRPARMLSCSLFPADSLIGVECMYEYADGICESGIWVEGSEYMRFETGCSISTLLYEDGKAYCILDPEGGNGLIFRAGELENAPEGYFCADERAMAVHEGSLYVALSSTRGDRPVIWCDGRTDTLSLNGCVSSITFTERRGDYDSQVRVRD